MADHVTAELDKELGVAQALVASAALDGPDLAAFRTEARRLAEARPLWETVDLFDHAGKLVLDLLRSPGDPLRPARDPDSIRVVIQSGEAVVGSIGPAIEDSGDRTIPLRVPVLRDGELRFVLSIELRPSSVSGVHAPSLSASADL